MYNIFQNYNLCSKKKKDLILYLLNIKDIFESSGFKKLISENYMLLLRSELKFKLPGRMF